MERGQAINKVVVTEEAKFDYEETVADTLMPKADIKRETEMYIDNLNKSRRLLWENYFRVKFYDENSDKMLVLFLYRAERIGMMQLWSLDGICEADDWMKEAEDDGEIRNWLKTKIADLPEETDWVITLRLWQEQQQKLQDEWE